MERQIPSVRPLSWAFGADEAVARWPRDVPLAALVSGGAGRWSRWSVFTAPVVSESSYGVGDDALGVADRWRCRAEPVTADGERLPFAGGWVCGIEYGVGAAIEPRAAGAGRKGPAGALWLRCPGAYVLDHLRGRWHCVGDDAVLPDLGALEARREAFGVSALRPGTSRSRYEGAVRRAVEYIRDGDIFQANLAHALSAEFEGSARSLMVDLVRGCGAWYGAFIEDPCSGRAVLSISPELFIDVDFASGRVVTRPIKGTRPPALAHELRASEKDGAELVMIVDLMRNDLGRVCRYGSVSVESARVIERHAGVAHGVATVSGLLREGVGPGGLLRATFPAGSVTGAPKIRAMQIIDELETFDRGLYCGAIGMLSDCGHASWNVAIRTATISGGRLVYPVGAGIVADSVASQEWEETLQKSEAFARVLAGASGSRARAASAVGG